MAYVPSCRHDIFLSYSHFDDKLTPHMKEGWVTTLLKCIDAKLSSRLGVNVSHWFDAEMYRNLEISSQLIDHLQNSATLIVVLSKGYINSEWCRKERNAFLAFVKKDISRVFIIERTPIEEEDLPSEFKNILRYPFWVKDNIKNEERTLGDPSLLNEDCQAYYSMLNTLLVQLTNKLNELTGNKIVKLEKFRSSIFLAHVSDDLEILRNNVKSYFEQAGIDVLPNACYHMDSNHFKECLINDLAKCEVFVQLLSKLPGKKPPDLPQGYIKFQLEYAMSANKIIYQWRDPSLNLDDIREQDPHHYALINGDNVRAEGIEDFKRAIKEFLEKPKEVKKSKLSAMIFLNRDVLDQPLAEKIGSFLDKQNIAWSTPPNMDNDDPGDNRIIYEENLKECNGIIIIYGSSPASWVNHQLNEYLKIRGNNNPPRFLVIFEGPPEQKSEITMHIKNMQILNFRKGIDEKLLEEQLNIFITKLREDE